MRLTELRPQFLRWEQEDGKTILRHVDWPQAMGVLFLCPKCFQVNGGPKGTHSVICWSRSRGTPEEARPAPGRWAMEGTGYDDLTLNADEPGRGRSILLGGDCAWHGYITRGEVTDA